MKKLIPGQLAPVFKLSDISGNDFNLESLQGKRYVLTFYRFAACPFCNLRLHKMIDDYPSWGNDFEVVAVFDSSLDNLRRFATRHQSPFPVLADESASIHRLYNTEHSITGVLKGIVFRFPALLKAMFINAYIPWRIKGDITGMPADFLVDENGIIVEAYYGKDEGDHISLHRVKKFAQRSDEISMDFQEI